MVVVQLVNFSIVPIHLQVPYCAAVSFVWTIILSCMRGADTGAVEDTQAVEATTDVADVLLIEATPASDKPAAAASGTEGARSASASAPEAIRTPAGAEKLPEGAVATGTGVPVGGILAVVRCLSHACSCAALASHAYAVVPAIAVGFTEAVGFAQHKY